MTNVNVRVNASTDDAVFSPSFYQYNDAENFLYMGFFFTAVGQTGMRFLGANIPSGATVDDADITLTNSAFEGDSNTTDIYCEDSGTPATFSSGSTPADRTKTSASVAWALASDGAPGDTRTTPDLVTIVQEVVDGNSGATDLVFIVVGRASNDYNIWDSYDGSPTTAPLLDLNYTAGAGGGEVAGAATIAATSSVTATASVEKAATASLSAAATVNAVASVTKAATAAIAGTSTVTATASVTKSASATIAATSTVTASATVTDFNLASATISATSNVSATASVEKAASASISGTSSVSAEANVQKLAVVLIASLSAMAATASVEKSASATIAAVSALTAVVSSITPLNRITVADARFRAMATGKARYAAQADSLGRYAPIAEAAGRHSPTTTGQARKGS